MPRIRTGEGEVVARRRALPNGAVTLVATLAVIYILSWASAFFVPVMLALVLSCAFTPAVGLLERARVPKALGAALVLGLLVGGTGYLAWTLSDEASDLIDTLPRAMQDLRTTLRKEKPQPVSAIEKVQKAATQLESAASEAVAKAPAPPPDVTKVQIVEPGLRVTDWIWSGTLGAAGAFGQLLLVLFLTYFFLSSGELFRRKLLKISGPTLGRKKVTLQVVDEITGNIQRYLLVQVSTSVLVGIATWLAFGWIGLRNAAVWGISAAVFNTVPYVGPVVVTAGSTVVGAVQFGSFSRGLMVGAVGLVITSLEGYVLTPWLTGRAGRLNPVVVFLSVAFWGWLWGAWGLLLGVPIVMMVKAICDRVEGWQPVGELLGD